MRTKMNDQTIRLDVTVEETNLILEALGALPFSQVYRLIAQLQQQATDQLNSDDATELSMSESTDSSLTAEEAA